VVVATFDGSAPTTVCGHMCQQAAIAIDTADSIIFTSFYISQGMWNIDTPEDTKVRYRLVVRFLCPVNKESAGLRPATVRAG